MQLPPKILGSINRSRRGVFMDVVPVPDVYTDSASIYLNDWGITLDFRASIPPKSPSASPTEAIAIGFEMDRKAMVRMSHAHAKAFSIILKRHLKEYEKQSGFIKLPDRVVEGLKINPEEW